MAIARSDEGVGDEAITGATGRPPEEWFALLDAAGAAEWVHRDIAAWLVREQGVDPWWAQSITVRFEQARGLRLPGQQADGTFTAAASRTVDGTVDEVYPRLVAAFTTVHDAPASHRATGARPYARFHAPQGSVLVTAEATPNGRVKVGGTHERLPDPDAADAAKAALRSILAAL